MVSSSRKLRIVIVGAGIGGASAALGCALQGHEVVFLEAAHGISEVGAGIQLAPNMFRILQRWGLGPSFVRNSVSLSKVHLRRWKTRETLGIAPVDNTTYGKQYVIHQADLHRIILDRARSLPNVTVETNARVVDVDFAAPSVTIKDGRVIHGDAVLGADGIKSVIREKMMMGDREKRDPTATGDCAYRLIIPLAALEADEELAGLARSTAGQRWIGPGRHIMAYPMKRHSLLNMVLIFPDDDMKTASESWNEKASKREMLDTFKGWDPVVLKLLRKASDDGVMKWKLCVHNPLPTWSKGKVSLLGDACHPMLPYVAQGAAQAVEDAATLSILLSSLQNRSQLPAVLATYEQVRKPRCERIQSTATAQRDVLHLDDGPAQVARDRLLAEVLAGGENPDKWGDRSEQKFLWGWDAEAVAEAAVVESGMKIESSRL